MDLARQDLNFRLFAAVFISTLPLGFCSQTWALEQVAEEQILNCETLALEEIDSHLSEFIKENNWKDKISPLEETVSSNCLVDILLTLGEISVKDKDHEKAVEIYRYLGSFLENAHSRSQNPNSLAHAEVFNHNTELDISEEIDSSIYSEHFNIEGANFAQRPNSIGELQGIARSFWESRQYAEFIYAINTLSDTLEKRIIESSFQADNALEIGDEKNSSEEDRGLDRANVAQTLPAALEYSPLRSFSEEVGDKKTNLIEPNLAKKSLVLLPASLYAGDQLNEGSESSTLILGAESKQESETDSEDNTPASEESLSRATQLINEGNTNFEQGNAKDALERFQQAFDLLHRALSIEKAEALLGMAAARAALNNPDEAKENIRAASSLLERISDSERKADILGKSAQLYFSLEEYDAGVDAAKKALAIYREYKGSERKQADTLFYLGNTLYSLRRYDEALEIYQQLADLFEVLEDLSGQSLAYLNLGSVYFDLNRFSEAKQRYSQAVSLLRELENKKTGLALALLRLSDADLKLEEFDLARKSAEEVLSILEALTTEDIQAETGEDSLDIASLQRHAYSIISASYLGVNRYGVALETLDLSLELTRGAANLREDLGRWPETIRLARGIVDLLLLVNPASFGFLSAFQGLLTLSDFSLTVIENVDVAADIWSGFNADRVRRPLDRAEVSLRSQLENARSNNSPLDEISALLGLGQVQLELQRFEDAKKSYAKALELTEAGGDLANKAAALLGLCNSSYYLFDHEELKKNADDLLILSARNEFDNQEFYLASAYLSLARASFLISDPSKTQEHAEEARKRFDKLKNSETLTESDLTDASISSGLANSHLLLGSNFLRSGDYEKAIDSAELALDIFQGQLRDLSGEASALLILSAANEKLGQYEQTIDLARQALYISRNIGDLIGEASALNNIGNALYSQRLFRQSRESFRLAKDILDTQSQIKERTSRRGIFPQFAGRLEAFAAFIGSYFGGLGGLGNFITATRSIANISEGVTSFAGLSNADFLLGETEQALQHFQDTQKISQSLGDVRGEVDALLGLSRIYLIQGKYGDAKDRAAEAIEKADSIGYRSGLGYAYFALSQAYLNLAKNNAELYEDAFFSAQEALILFEEINEPEGIALAWGSLGDVLAAQGQTIAAVTFYKKAVEIKEKIEAGITSSHLQISYSRSSLEIYRKLIDLLVQQKTRLWEALYYVELLRIKELEDYTNEERWSDLIIENTLLPTESKILNSDYSTLREFGQDYRICNETGEGCTLSNTSEDIRDIRRNLYADFLQKMIELEGEREVDRSELPPTAFAALADQVIAEQSGTVVIYPVVLDRKLVLIWASAKGTISRRELAISRQEIDTEIINLLSLIESKGDLEALQGTSRRFYEWLIQPIEEELSSDEVKNLVFSLDRSLRYIPLAAIYDGQNYLIERYTVSTVLPGGQKRFSQRFADTSRGARVLGFGVSAGKPALPHVDTELDNIIKDERNPEDTRGVYPGRVWRNSEFTFESLRDSLRGGQIIHIATHGVFVPNGDRESSYLLMGDGKPLAMTNISSLQSNMEEARLVVLSACETLRGGVSNLEGLEIPALASYFIPAYSNYAVSVVASLWRVNDPATSSLMGKFYENLKMSEQDPTMTQARALQQAQLALLRGNTSSPDGTKQIIPVPLDPEAPSPASNWAHPYYWAPFVLIGNSL